MKNLFWLLIALSMGLALSACTLDAVQKNCIPGETRCSDDTFQKCMLDGVSWDEILCGTQANPDMFCHSEHVCVACNDDKDCRSAQKHCVEHVCEELSVQGCVAGTQSCKNSKVYTCSKKAWENGVFCPEGCNAAGTACATAAEKCQENTKRCGDSVVEICVAGVWKLETQCESTAFCNANTYTCDTVICTGNEKRCDDNAVQVCQNNAWKIDTQCVGKEVCDAESFTCEIPPCTQGAKRCNANVVETCNASGEYKPSVQCSTGYHCLEVVDQTAQVTTACVECLGSEQRCRNNAIENCVNNVWKAGQACENRLCNPQTYTCVDVLCGSGAERCNGNRVEVCNTTGKFGTSYVPKQPAACAIGEHCIEKPDHKTACVGCTKDEHCNTMQRCNTITNVCMYVQ